MDHQLISPDVEDDQFEQVPSPVGSREQVARRIIAQLGLGDRVHQGMFDVLVGDAVVPSRLVDLHTE